MAAYLTPEEYTSLTGKAPPADFESCESEAEQVIDNLTLYRLHPGGPDALPEYPRLQVKQAAAKVIYLIAQAGGYDTYMAKQHQKITAEKVGGYSVNYTDGTNTAQRINQTVTSYLWPTGLLYKGIG